MENPVVEATKEERDRLVALIALATEGWDGDLPRPEVWSAYVAALNAARRNLEEAVKIIEDAQRA
jgi:hypothetical protein